MANDQSSVSLVDQAVLHFTLGEEQKAETMLEQFLADCPEDLAVGEPWQKLD